jgi:hypothetical protein
MHCGCWVLLALVACTPRPSIEVVPNANAGTIHAISRGVLFVDAQWSVPSQQARIEMIRTLVDVPAEIVIADIDQAELTDVPELRVLHGAGEQAWIVGGTICFACAGSQCLERGRALMLRSRFTPTC